MYFRWVQGPVQGGCVKAAHTLQVDGVEQLVSGKGPPDFRLPATLQQYVEHGGCLFKVRGMHCPKFEEEPCNTQKELYLWLTSCAPGL